MARSSTSFKKGQSGNPGGMPGRSPRAALRDALRAAIPGKGNKTRLTQWAEDLITNTVDPAERLKILQYVDPPRSDQDVWAATDDQAAKPRLEIPADDALSPGEELLLRGVKAGKIKPSEVGDLMADAEKAAKLGDAK